MNNPLRRSTSCSQIPISRSRSSVRTTLAPKPGPRSSSNDALHSTYQLNRRSSKGTLNLGVGVGNADKNCSRSLSRENLSKTSSARKYDHRSSQKPGWQRATLNVGLNRPSSARSISRENLHMMPTSSSKRYDTRPINEKTWQKHTWQKVQNYFATQLGIDTKTLRPLQTLTFINVMNRLFKIIDSQIEINKANYQVEIPSILEKLRYPWKINDKMFLTVGAGHMFHRILAIWDWLTEQIILLDENIETSFNNINSVLMFSPLTSSFADAFFQKKSEEELELEIEMNFLSIVSYDEEKYERLKSSVEKLELKEQKGQASLDALNGESEKQRAKIGQLRSKCESYVDKSRILLSELNAGIDKITKENIASCELLLVKEKENERLDNIIANQKYNSSDLLKALQEEKELNEKISLAEERINSSVERIQEYKAKVSDLTVKTTSIICQRNTLIREYSGYENSLRDLLIREDDLHRDDMFQEIEKSAKLMKKLSAECQKAINKRRKKLKKIKHDAEHKDTLRAQLAETTAKEQRCRDKLQELQRTRTKELQSYIDQIHTLHNNFEEVENLPDVNGIYQSLVQICEKNEKLESNFKHQYDKAVYFIMEILKQCIDLVQFSGQQYHEVTRYINEYKGSVKK